MSEQQDSYEGLTGVVVGHDRSASADRAIAFGAEEARLRGWPLHVVRAWSLTHAPRPEGFEPGVVPPLEEYGEAVRRELVPPRTTTKPASTRCLAWSSNRRAWRLLPKTV